jgi:regulator of sigma E protease
MLMPVLALINPVSTLIAALGLGMVIFFHELGHFLVAKWCGVYVERFSIGFGQPILSRKWGDTEYALGWLPLGGYVKMRGQDDMDPGEMTDAQVAEDPRSYTAKNVPQRMAIISAGVIMNVITGLLFFSAVFLMGIHVEAPVAGNVIVGGPAWKVGVRSGDVIESINGYAVRDFQGMTVNTVLSRGVLQVTGKHADGTPFQVSIEPRQDTHRVMGIISSHSLTVPEFPPTEKMDPFEPASAAAQSGIQPGDTIVSVDGQRIETYDELARFLADRAAETVVLGVERKVPGSQSTQQVELSLPPQRGRELGFRLSMGKIIALQAGRPALAAGFQEGDRITKVDGKDVESELDPFRLTEYFTERAGQTVVVTVSREIEGSAPTTLELSVIPESRSAWSEPPAVKESPLSIPALGLAYRLVPTVFSVTPDSPAAQLQIAPRDTIKRVQLIRPKGEKDLFRDEIIDLPISEKETNWSHAYWLMQTSARNRQVKLTIQNSSGERTIDITPVESTDWFLQDTRGLLLANSQLSRRAESFPEAFAMATDFTLSSIRQVYLTLRGLITGDISLKLLSGPVGIARLAYRTAEVGPTSFIMFLGMISINLAVVNFLPIPVLDGGHMVLLLWEGITRRKPNEKVVGIATWIGLCLLLTLIATVLYIDIFVSKP